VYIEKGAKVLSGTLPPNNSISLAKTPLCSETKNLSYPS